MKTVTDHYASHLAPIYSWMVGDFEDACEQVELMCHKVGIPDGAGRLAVDLGCGHGIHTVTLSKRGYRVLAIDSSSQLLGELQSQAGELPIRIVEDDLTQFEKHITDESPALICCMGDTLPHLSSDAVVSKVIRDAANCLCPNGVLLLSLRDYVNQELKGVERFIPVRSDGARIHTCFLEYRADDVVVHDIIQTRTDTNWKTAVSSYLKLRLCPDNLIAIAESNGLLLSHRADIRSMVHIAFKKANSRE